VEDLWQGSGFRVQGSGLNGPIPGPPEALTLRYGAQVRSRWWLSCRPNSKTRAREQDFVPARALYQHELRGGARSVGGAQPGGGTDLEVWCTMCGMAGQEPVVDELSSEEQDESKSGASLVFVVDRCGGCPVAVALTLRYRGTSLIRNYPPPRTTVGP
jgi:hypothetical protein